MVVVDVEDVVVVVVRQPSETQASQQLGTGALHARPPFGATQPAALRWTEHEVVPALRVRQQATEPGLPHVDLEAQRLTTETQLLFTTVALACPAAQAT
jgi:hypothetical protein